MGAVRTLLLSSNFLPLCFAIFLLLRIPLILFIEVIPYSDAGWYFARAIGLAAGEGYSEGGNPTAYWPVGYPGMLATVFTLFGDRVFVGQLANLVFSCGVFVGLYHLTKNISQDETLARLTIFGFTIYPNQIAYTNLLLTEIFYTCMLIWAFVFVTGRNSVLRWLIGGLLFGLCTLTKTQTVLFPAFLFILIFVIHTIQGRCLDCYLIFRNILIKSFLVYFAMILVVLPWTWRNYQVFDGFVFVSTNAGRILIESNHPNATGDWPPNDSPLQTQITIPWEERVARQVEYDKMAKRIVLDWIKANPGMFLGLAPRKIFSLWGPDGEGEWGYQAGYANYENYKSVFRAVRYINQAYYFFIIGLSLIALVSAFYRKEMFELAYRLLAWPVYVTIIAIVFHGEPRYHFSAMPFILILAAMSIKQFIFRKRSGGSRGRAFHHR